MACVSGAPPAGVAVVRLSGAGSWDIAASIFHPFPTSPESHRAYYGKLNSGDDGLALLFASGQSFTGEETVEFQIHGSRSSIESCLASCMSAGARMAKPGEFSERAFLHGRIDLTQAEAIRDTIEAQTESQMRQANLIRSGALRAQLSQIQALITSVRAQIEAVVDFSEEIGDLDRSVAIAMLREATKKVAALLQTRDAGQFLRNGVRIAIAGLPNAGKSSLMNWILGRNRVIVHERPGTTRDYVEESVQIGKALVTLIDTAGLRLADDEVEKEGIERARQIIESADLVWYLVDSQVGLTEADRAEIASITRPKCLVPTKGDLTGNDAAISSVAGTGIERLELHLNEFCGSEIWETSPLIRPRYEPHLQRVSESLVRAIETLDSDLPFDLASVMLQLATEEIGQITGESASGDVLDSIFRDFCIGK